MASPREINSEVGVEFGDVEVGGVEVDVASEVDVAVEVDVAF